MNQSTDQEVSERMARAAKIASLREQEEALCRLPTAAEIDLDDEDYDPFGLYEEPDDESMSYVDELTEGLGK